MVDILLGILAVVAGYLIGGFPSAYIVTKVVTNKDIRTIGTGHTGRGNVGTRNVFVNVGKIPGIVVAILDILKGVFAVFLARWLLDRSGLVASDEHVAALFVLGAGLAAVIGHIWPVYIRFKGGAGLATSLGVLAVIMPQDLALALIIAIVLIFVTRNVLLSVNLSLISVPLWAWFHQYRWTLVVFPLVLLVIMFSHFLPNIIAEYKKAGSVRNLLAGLLLRNRTKARK